MILFLVVTLVSLGLVLGLLAPVLITMSKALKSESYPAKKRNKE